MNRVLGGLGVVVAVVLAGCGRTVTRVVTKTVEASRTITVVPGVQTLSSDPTPLPSSGSPGPITSSIIDPAGTTIATYFGKLAGFGAAALQTNLAKQGAYWHYERAPNVPFATPVCQYRLPHTSMRVEIGVAEGTRTRPTLANAVCAELLAVGWRPAAQSLG